MDPIAWYQHAISMKAAQQAFLQYVTARVGTFPRNQIGMAVGVLTDLLVGYLRDKGVYVAGNSAITLRSIRQAKTFAEWRQDILLLKVSRGSHYFQYLKPTSHMGLHLSWFLALGISLHGTKLRCGAQAMFAFPFRPGATSHASYSGF